MDRPSRRIRSLKRQGYTNLLSRIHKPSNPEAVVPLQQVNISGILSASARHGSSKVANLNSALVSDSDKSSNLYSQSYRISNTGNKDSFCLLFLKLTAILLHRSCRLRKEQLKPPALTFCLTFRRRNCFVACCCKLPI